MSGQFKCLWGQGGDTDQSSYIRIRNRVLGPGAERGVATWLDSAAPGPARLILFAGVLQAPADPADPAQGPAPPLPAHAELHVGVKEAHDRRRGDLPALQPSPDQAFSPAVSDDFHKARVPLADVLVQVELELHCGGHRDVSGVTPREGLRPPRPTVVVCPGSIFHKHLRGPTVAGCGFGVLGGDLREIRAHLTELHSSGRGNEHSSQTDSDRGTCYKDRRKRG